MANLMQHLKAPSVLSMNCPVYRVSQGEALEAMMFMLGLGIMLIQWPKKSWSGESMRIMLGAWVLINVTSQV